MKYSQKSHFSTGYHNMTVVLFTLLCVLICGSLALSPKAQTKTSDEQVTPKTVPGRNGKIAFTSSRDGNHQIYSMEADGSNQTRLTNNPGYEGSPKWSPDGTKIAFLRSNGSQYDIYVMNADGSNQTRLTNNLAAVEPPDWSPDGTRIVCAHESYLGNDFTREIFVVNADGTNQTQLTNSGHNDSQRWSPDGTRIVFRRFRSAVGIYVMKADGSNQTQLTNSAYDYSPRWSPDGTRVLFESWRDGNNEIFLMNADGSNQTRLAINPSVDQSPEWSPDGTRIVFISRRDNNNNSNIYVMNADGTSQTRLTNYAEGYEVVSPIFSPDGMRIMFAYGESWGGELLSSQIYVMNADGSNLVRLTNTAAGNYEFEVDWQALPQTAANSIDDAQFFVRQHYSDFLNREPDSDGLAFWTNPITSCGRDRACIEAARINDSGAFFLSIEFQETGYLAYRTYLAAFGNLPNAPVPITFNEFVPDTQALGRDVIVRQSGWEQVLDNNKRAFFSAFVQRQRFTNAFPPAMSAGEYVDKLNANAGNPLSQTERDQLVSDLFGGQRSRADVLRAVAENSKLAQAEFNRAFVLMQYFGYLRRNPNDAPDGNFVGYNFWLDKLNQFNGNFIEAEMVKAFITSTEYRQRFGP
jgi:Tol biopolymer transport system component